MKKLLMFIISVAMLINILPPPVAAANEMQIGEYMIMGTYAGEDILWRCVDITDDGALMMADTVLVSRAFDAAGTDAQGSHGRGYIKDGVQGALRQEHGSNYWGDSNLHDWLNSDAQSVEYTCGNGTDEEAGFLYGFSETEKAAMKEVTQKQLLNAYEYSTDNTREPNHYIYVSAIANSQQNYKSAYCEESAEKVFLPDIAQIYDVYKQKAALGDGYYIAKTDDGACATWLRTPYCRAEDCAVLIVSPDGSIADCFADETNVGVRPMFYYESDATLLGSGKRFNPYYIESDNAIKLGDYFEMGIYNGESIIWRAVAQQGKNILMLSDKALCEKAYDAGGDNSQGSHGSDADRAWYGSHYWGDSNIRCWLQSDAEAGEVEYTCGNPPDYAAEAGFMTSFNESERELIRTVSQKSITGNDEYAYKYDTNVYYGGGGVYGTPSEMLLNYDTAKFEYIEDTVFLLDIKQLCSVYLNENILGENYISSVGELQARILTRNPSNDGNNEIEVVECYTDKVLSQRPYGVGWVRPAFYINGDSADLVGAGTLEEPLMLADAQQIKPQPEIEIEEEEKIEDEEKEEKESTPNIFTPIEPEVETRAEEKEEAAPDVFTPLEPEAEVEGEVEPEAEGEAEGEVEVEPEVEPEGEAEGEVEDTPVLASMFTQPTLTFIIIGFLLLIFGILFAGVMAKRQKSKK